MWIGSEKGSDLLCSDDPCGVWPAGLAITGDLEEDLIRWEAAELKASRDPCSLDEESLTSDSDDAIPLPAARSRPSNVPPLALGGTSRCSHFKFTVSNCIGWCLNSM